MPARLAANQVLDFIREMKRRRSESAVNMMAQKWMRLRLKCWRHWCVNVRMLWLRVWLTRPIWPMLRACSGLGFRHIQVGPYFGMKQ